MISGNMACTVKHKFSQRLAASHKKPVSLLIECFSQYEKLQEFGLITSSLKNV